MRKWVSLYVIGTMEGQDPTLMAARIDWHHIKLAESDFKTKLRIYWDKFLTDQKDDCRRAWMSKIGDGEYMAYSRDLAKLRQNTQQNMNDYIDYQRGTEVERHKQNQNHTQAAYLSQKMDYLAARLGEEVSRVLDLQREERYRSNSMASQN